MVFHGSLSDSKSSQVSRTLLSILAILSNVVIWIVSTRLPTFTSSRPFNYPLVIVLNAPITIDTIAIFMFHSFFNSLARSKDLSFHFYSVVSWDSKVHNFASSHVFFCFFFLISIRSGLLAKIRWSVCMSKSHRSLCVEFSRTGAGLCIYHLFVKFKFLAHFPVDHLADPVVSHRILLLC